MQRHIINFFLEFTNRKFSTSRKLASMIPGIFIFLIISPLVIFKISASLARYAPLHIPRHTELAIMLLALSSAVALMSWALLELWFKGNGSPAPIAPTNRLVVSGPYHWCRNPIEMGTNIYFLAIGTLFDSLPTGLLCLLFGLVLGIGYIKLIEEKEMLLRFGAPYRDYMQSVPFMAVPFFPRLKRGRPQQK